MSSRQRCTRRAGMHGAPGQAGGPDDALTWRTCKPPRQRIHSTHPLPHGKHKRGTSTPPRTRQHSMHPSARGRHKRGTTSRGQQAGDNKQGTTSRGQQARHACVNTACTHHPYWLHQPDSSPADTALRNGCAPPPSNTNSPRKAQRRGSSPSARHICMRVSVVHARVRLRAGGARGCTRTGLTSITHRDPPPSEEKDVAMGSGHPPPHNCTCASQRRACNAAPSIHSHRLMSAVSQVGEPWC